MSEPREAITATGNEPGPVMAKVALEPAPILHPHPVLLVGTYGADGKPNLMNAAWGGICCSEPPCVAVSLREATLTYHNIVHARAFTVGIPSRAQVGIADYVGIVSGRDHDKFRDTGLTPTKSEKVNAPVAAELPFSLECKLREHHQLGLHTIFIGEIVGIQADQEVLGPKGIPDIEKTQAILWGGFGSNHYFAVGEKLGRAFSVGRGLKK
jgi:flavin reductase (DIM6/NTAB) family NADH-FMN oxidoreductase RutF